MDNAEKLKGEKFIFWGALLWAFFPIVVIISSTNLPSLVSLAWSTVFATLFFLGVIFYRKSWKELQNKLFWKYVLGVAIFNGVLFYGLYYVGLESTTAGNASLIGLTEILTSFLFFNLFKKEHISKEHKVGAVLMFMGAFIVLSNNFSHLNAGDFLILLAMFCGPIGNHFQQKARKVVSAEVLLFARYLISAPFVFLFAYLLNNEISLELTTASFLLVFLNGILIFGISKVLWVEAIHRVPVTKAISLSSFSPLITLFLAWLILHQPPTFWQLTSFVPLFIGILLLTDNLKLKQASIYEPPI